VHNGIIENYLDLKRELVAQGHRFESETDTEVVAHLVQQEWRDDGLEAAVRRAMTRVRGLFALVLLSADDPNKLVAVRNGPPIVVGLGEGEFFVASDVPAILAHTRNVVFMDDREMVVVTAAGATFSSLDGTPARARAHARDVGSGDGREGRLQALHAEGDHRAAARAA
jgi:glutamine---fructose-6-phosphate transaminase (isomerizing)